MQEIKVISYPNESYFESLVNNLLKEGWKISSTNCGFLNSENYGFKDVYQAILIREVST